MMHHMREGFVSSLNNIINIYAITGLGIIVMVIRGFVLDMEGMIYEDL